MKLPKLNLRESNGFTLVELMVVIAVIAILSVMTFGIYNGIQSSARDSKRQGEISALAKNIEATRDAVTGDYSYSPVKFNADYPNNLLDPDGLGYCLLMAATAAGAAPPTANPTGSSAWACPAIIGTAASGGGAGGIFENVSGFTGTNKYFTVCATRSERGSKPICQTQFLR